MRSAGFTLVELAIVTVVIGILAMMVAPGIQEARRRAQLPALQSDLRRLIQLQELYHDAHGVYSADLAALDFEASEGVRITVKLPGGPEHAQGGGVGLDKQRGDGYSAVARVEDTPSVRCAVFTGESEAVEPAEVPLRIGCETE